MSKGKMFVEVLDLRIMDEFLAMGQVSLLHNYGVPPRPTCMTLRSDKEFEQKHLDANALNHWRNK